MQFKKPERELNTTITKKRNLLYGHTLRSPGQLISQAGGNGTIDFTSEVQDDNVSFESDHGFDYDSLKIAEVGNVFHLHTKTYLLRHLQSMNRQKLTKQHVSEITKLHGVFSLDVTTATICDGEQSAATEAVLVIVAGVVLVLRRKDMRRAIPTFSLDDVHGFIHASNILNHGAFAFGDSNFSAKMQCSHLVVASPKL